MAKKPQSVREYLDALPPDRRTAVETLREVMLANLDKGIREGIQYGMIGYFIPHERYPAGYHCDPAQPLPFAGLASQKQHLSLYLMGCYADGPWKERFITAWKASGKKLDMGAACVRFKTIEQVPLDVVAQTVRAMTADAYIAHYESMLGPSARKAAASGAARAVASTRTKTPAKKKAAPTTSKGKSSKGTRSKGKSSKGKAASKPSSRRTRP